MNSMGILHVVKLKRLLHNIRKILVLLVGLARLLRTWMMILGLHPISVGLHVLGKLNANKPAINILTKTISRILPYTVLNRYIFQSSPLSLFQLLATLQLLRLFTSNVYLELIQFQIYGVGVALDSKTH